jgi:hypothetical protein
MKTTAKTSKGDGSWAGTEILEVEATYTLYPDSKVAILNRCLPKRHMQTLELHLMLLEGDDSTEPKGSTKVPDGYFLIEDAFTLNDYMETVTA